MAHAAYASLSVQNNKRLLFSGQVSLLITIRILQRICSEGKNVLAGHKLVLTRQNVCILHGVHTVYILLLFNLLVMVVLKHCPSMVYISLCLQLVKNFMMTTFAETQTENCLISFQFIW